MDMGNYIHRFWGGSEMPERYQQYGRRWAELNPDWSVLHWTVDDVLNLGIQNEEQFRYVLERGANTSIPHKSEVAKYTQLADIAAYEIIYRFGGLYVNCDMEPVRPISKLPVDFGKDAFACREIFHWINNGALGGVKFHPFWKRVIDELPVRMAALPDSAMHIQTGPHLLTDVSERHPGELKVLDQFYFNWVPLHLVENGQRELTKQQRQTAIRKGAVVLHHWGHKAPESRTDQ